MVKGTDELVCEGVASEFVILLSTSQEIMYIALGDSCTLEKWEGWLESCEQFANAFI